MKESPWAKQARKKGPYTRTEGELHHPDCGRALQFQQIETSWKRRVAFIKFGEPCLFTIQPFS